MKTMVVTLASMTLGPDDAGLGGKRCGVSGHVEEG